MLMMGVMMSGDSTIESEHMIDFDANEKEQVDGNLIV